MLPLATPRTWVVGEVVTAALMNAELRDQLSALRSAEEIIYKPTAEPVTSSATLQNDNHLLVSLAANASYKIMLHVAVTGSGSGDFKCAWTFPAGVTTARYSRGPAVSATGSTADTTIRCSTIINSHTTEINYGVFNTTNPSFVEEIVYVTTGATAGTGQLQWAQNVSTGTATQVEAGSFIECRRIA